MINLLTRYCSLLLIMLMLSLAACTARERRGVVGPDADPGAVPDLTGEYAVNGFDPLNTEYGGRLTITPGETPDTYTLQWIVTGSLQTGTGRVEGNQLLVEWQAVDSTVPVRGTATYTITVNGELYGTRTVVGSEQPGTETAFPNAD
jgi:hypothetical protein